MPTLTIRHITTYRYRQPVVLGEHRMMLRPRDTSDQRVLKASLEISPEPTCLRFVQDAFGNHLGIAEFSGLSKELSFESVACVEHSPPDVARLEIEEYARTFPFAYSAGEMPDLARYVERHHPRSGKRDRAAGFANSCLEAALWVLWSFSPASRRASIKASATGDGKQRGSRSRWRRFSSVTAAAAT